MIIVGYSGVAMPIAPGGACTRASKGNNRIHDALDGVVVLAGRCADRLALPPQPPAAVVTAMIAIRQARLDLIPMEQLSHRCANGP
jgi:hypothetical protein